MAKLAWDQTGQRPYEIGIDHGVLYLSDGRVVAWNGLTSVDEEFKDDISTPYYLDGVKYLDSIGTGDFIGTLKALTYPDEFLECTGIAEVSAGLFANYQANTQFGLAYRTKIGNDTESDFGYKLHILYNLLAVEDEPSYGSLTDRTTALEFTWKLSAIPESIPGYVPTAHIIIDSRYVNPYLLPFLEGILYGDDDTPASLPSLEQLVLYIQLWHFITVVDNGDGTWTATGPSEYITMLDSTTFQIASTNAVFIDADTYMIGSSDLP